MSASVLVSTAEVESSRIRILGFLSRARADVYGHGKGRDQHDRGAHSDANNHLISVLSIGDIGRQTGDDTGGGKLIDVGERKVLYVVVDVVTQIACQACRGIGCCAAGQDTENQGAYGPMRMPPRRRISP